MYKNKNVLDTQQSEQRNDNKITPAPKLIN